MAFDALVKPQAAIVTKTASFDSAQTDLGCAAPMRKPLWVRVRYYAAENDSGSNTALFGWEEYDEETSSYFDHSFGRPIALTTTAKQGVVYVPVVGVGRYGRLTLTVSGAGTNPTITYGADLADSQ
jgi:hypothetical protein